MKWYNLKNNKCPSCSSFLTGSEKATILKCSNPSCLFKIGTERFAQLSREYVNKFGLQNRFSDIEGWARFEE
jgi:hypothetical protein